MTLAAPPETPPQSRWQRVRPPVLLAGGLLAASVALHLRDPHDSGSWGYCPWFMMTGTYCPGCGGLRAVNDLTRGDVAGAASSNILFFASLPLVAWLWVRSFAGRWRGTAAPLPPRTVNLLLGGFAAAVLVFWVVRNLPGLTWLTP